MEVNGIPAIYPYSNMTSCSMNVSSNENQSPFLKYRWHVEMKARGMGNSERFALNNSRQDYAIERDNRQGQGLNVFKNKIEVDGNK